MNSSEIKKFNNIKSICILRLSAIGDCCHVVALVQHLQKHLPEVEITWVIGKLEASLISAILPNVKLIEFDKKQGFAAYSNLRKQLKNQTFDALLHLQPSMRANLASFFIKAKTKIGYHSSRSREFQNFFVNQQAPLGKGVGRGVHVAESFMDFATALGLPETTPRWEVAARQEDLNWAETYANNKTVIVCPGASKSEKNWTAEGYAKVIDLLASKGLDVVLVGSSSKVELELVEAISQLTQNYTHNLVGKSNLPQLLALIQLSKLVIAPDTGPAHMATLVSTPVIGLYATHNPQRTGPYNDLDKVISVYEKALFKETGKTPAEVGWRTRVKLPNAMQMLDEQEVLQMVEETIKKVSSCL